MDMNAIVGKRIANILEDKGWTQVKLADKMNLSKQVMNNIIQGNKNITVAEVKKIGNILGVSVNDLTKPFTQEEKPEPIMAFMGEVNTIEAQEGLAKAEEIMDILLFHQKINNSFNEMVSK